MSSDKELLDLAAKAAGIDTSDEYNDEIGEWIFLHHRWNPLTDDGDALRLAVKLGILVSPNKDGKSLAALPTDDEMVTTHMLERHNADPYAATRRAIVRAAAEIGKQLK